MVAAGVRKYQPFSSLMILVEPDELETTQLHHLYHFSTYDPQIVPAGHNCKDNNACPELFDSSGGNDGNSMVEKPRW